MGKKKTRGEGSGLGRALIKERLNAGRGYRRNDTWLHTSELNDGYDWGRLNLQSVTEQSSLDDFLATAELAGTEFVAEKLNIKFVPAEARAGLLYFVSESNACFHYSVSPSCLVVKGEEPMDQEGQSDTEQEATSKNVTDLHEENSTSPNEEKDESEQEEEEESEEGRVCVDETEWQTCSEESGDEDHAEEKTESTTVSSFYNSSRLLRKDELLEMFKSVHSGPTCKDGQITVGLVGYPNVGKSSTINTILRNKKVSVSATPGHTKHFQTLFADPGLCLCDCPGLVMPSFLSTKAEMICSGILPIDQMRDHVPAISLVCQTIPRTVLEGTYGINIIRPREDEDPDRPPTYEELLMAYGYMRGFMTAHGQPDQSRSARYVLKDYVSGKLLYCHPPPHISPKDFQPQHARFARRSGGVEQIASDADKPSKVKRIENTVDKHFFHQENVRALTKGVQMVMGYNPGSGPVGPGNTNTEQQTGKPWKKHGNRNKKEKVRRLNKHLDA
ncbi:large subunit GTPase 1 homolog [Sinocyclocheilus rhinocerous]|uniref:large subunit GTPase 1 homolog n=1 Tax=Sinocyclocheilus rhinocerous TaxID=307959 RepID=UPI0007B7B792|nr:PREDICTED: large subunit GTPase 1 homolog [Sinocyclocheilus rhinocerous]